MPQVHHNPPGRTPVGLWWLRHQEGSADPPCPRTRLESSLAGEAGELLGQKLELGRRNVAKRHALVKRGGRATEKRDPDALSNPTK